MPHNPPGWASSIPYSGEEVFYGLMTLTPLRRRGCGSISCRSPCVLRSRYSHCNSSISPFVDLGARWIADISIKSNSRNRRPGKVKYRCRTRVKTD